jgi:hypothetical protein
MATWLSGTYDLFVHFFGRTTPMETYIVIAFCVLLGALAMSRIGTAFGAIGAFYTNGVLVTPFGLTLLIAAMAAPPVFGQKADWIPLAVAVLVFLVVVIPLTMLFQKGRYVPTLIAWTVTVLIVGAVLTLEPRVKRSFDGVKRGIENGRLFERSHTEIEWNK